MYFLRSLIILSVSVLCANSESINPYTLSQTPNNTAGVVDYTLTLNCVAASFQPNPHVEWYEYITKPKPDGEKISQRGNVVHPSRGDRYSIVGDNTIHEYHLKINSLQSDDSGEYGCHLVTDNYTSRAYAQVVVLEYSPDCDSYPIEPVEDDTQVTYSCYTEYTGRWAPIMTWNSTWAPLPPVANFTQGENVNYTFSINAKVDMNGAEFVCDTMFNQPQAEGGPGEADNVPVYQHTCGPLVLNVEYEPRYIEILPNSSIVTAGDTVRCQADANPTTMTYKWKDTQTGDTISSDTYRFPPGETGKRYMICEAFNPLGSVAKEFNFTVIAPTTTMSTTTTTTTQSSSSSSNTTSATTTPSPTDSGTNTVAIAIGSVLLVPCLVAAGVAIFFAIRYMRRSKDDLYQDVTKGPLSTQDVDYNDLGYTNPMGSNTGSQI